MRRRACDDVDRGGAKALKLLDLPDWRAMASMAGADLVDTIRQLQREKLAGPVPRLDDAHAHGPATISRPYFIRRA